MALLTLFETSKQSHFSTSAIRTKSCTARPYTTVITHRNQMALARRLQVKHRPASGHAPTQYPLQLLPNHFLDPVAVPTSPTKQARQAGKHGTAPAARTWSQPNAEGSKYQTLEQDQHAYERCTLRALSLRGASGCAPHGLKTYVAHKRKGVCCNTIQHILHTTKLPRPLHQPYLVKLAPNAASVRQLAHPAPLAYTPLGRLPCTATTACINSFQNAAANS